MGGQQVFELNQKFYFEAAHTLNRDHEAEGSKRIHGHTYLAEVGIQGTPAYGTGMVVDLAVLRGAIEQVRLKLDHQLLDDVPGLGQATLERLCMFIWEELEEAGMNPSRISVRREASGDGCTMQSA